MATVLKNNISVPKSEYLRLKYIDRRFKDFFNYFENLIEISEAKKEIKRGKIIPQEKLFKKLGF